jgi:hypothetical protein
MKKLMLAAVFAMAFFATSAWAKGKGHENDGTKPRINAESMSMIGLGAASAVGAGVYLARRAKRRS